MLILSGNWQNTSSFHVKDKKLRNYDLLEERYDKVCVSGDLSDDFDFGANVLPKGFYGSYINKGIFEIGYKAGVEENNTLPFIDVGYTGFISISVEFEHDLKDFKRATFIGGVGFELVIYNPKNGYKIQRSVYEHEYFKDAFSINDGNEYQYIDGKLPSTMSLSYKVDIKTLCFHLYLDEGDRISFLRYYYSDITEPVSNCSITKYGYDISVRNNHSCSKYSYVDKYGLNPVLELRGEYGTLYNKNYLFNLFSRYDYINKRVYYPDKIIDYDNYFESGYFAEIGSKFTIDFIEIDYKDVYGYYYELLKNTPLIIWSSDKEFNIVNDSAMGMYDVLPTVANLFGFSEKYSLGHDIFDDYYDNIVVFPNGNVLTDKVYYSDLNDEYIAFTDLPIERDYIDELRNYSETILDISNGIITHDLIRREESKIGRCENEQKER